VTRTVSGHEAIKSVSSPLLAAQKIPGTKITIRTRRSCLPLFLHLAAALNEGVEALSSRNTWSYNYRPIRMGEAVSDHAGYAIDCWSDGIGAHRWPSKMPATKAKKIGRILEQYITANGRYIFGWGASDQAPGVDYKGPTYHSQKANDPMHFFVAPGVGTKDLLEVRKALGIRLDGTVKVDKSVV
jgi:hypothetical protein